MEVGIPLPPLTEEKSRVRRGLGVLWTRGWVLGEQKQLESWDLWDSWLAIWLASVPGRVETKEFRKSLCLSLCLTESLFLWLAHSHSLFPPPTPPSLITPVVSSVMSTMGTCHASPSVCQHTASHNRKWHAQGELGTQSSGAELEMETLWLYCRLWSLLWWPGRHKGKSRTPQEDSRGCNFPFVFCRGCDFLLRRAVSAMPEIYVLE